MYGKCLITPTILDSYEFAKNAPMTWKSRAENGFLAKLRREKTDYPAWVSKGLAFEDTVYRVCNVHCNKPIDKGSELFKKVCEKCVGGVFQQKIQKTIKIGDNEVFFFGFMDVTLPEKIIDLKTTLNYKGPNKYLNGHQHLIYTMVTKIPKFEYLIAEWQDEYSNTIKDVHTVPYFVKDFEELENTVIKKVEDFFAYLQSNGLWLDYYQTFSKN